LWGRYHFNYTCTLRKSSKTTVGVHTRFGTENSIKSLVANDEKGIRILILGLLRSSKI